MKSFFACIAAHIGAKQLTGVIALLGLALLIPRSAPVSSVEVPATDDFSGLTTLSPTDAAPQVDVSGSQSAVVAKSVSATTQAKGQDLNSASTAQVTEPAPRTVPVLGFATASQKAQQGADATGFGKSAALGASGSGASSSSGRAGSSGAIGGLAAGGGGGGVGAGSGEAPTVKSATNELAHGAADGGSRNSDATAPSDPVTSSKPVPAESGSSASGIAARAGDQVGSPTSDLLAVPETTPIDQAQADGVASLNPVFGSGDENPDAAGQPAQKAQALAVATPVPDTGSTLFLLAGSVIGLFSIRRRAR